MGMTITHRDHGVHLSHHPWLPSTRPEVPGAMSLGLRQGTVLGLRGQAGRLHRWRRRRPSRLRIGCRAGEVWVTVEGDLYDHILVPDRMLDVPVDRLVVVQATADAVITIGEADADEPAPRR